jgi:polysaccharide biosynthesis/export protein
MSTDAKSRILRLLSLRETPRPRTTLLHRLSVAVAAFVALAAVACAQTEVKQGDKTLKRSPESPDVIPIATTKDGDEIRASQKGETELTDLVYILEPPDIVTIDPIRLLPKGPQRVEKLDELQIDVAGVHEDAPINGLFKVDSDGEISLGPLYGRVEIAGLTVKEAIQRIEQHLGKLLREPQVALTISDKWERKQIGGQHQIAVDGSLNLGLFGQVQVSGMTVNQARRAIERKLNEQFDKPSITLEVTVQNSKVFYVIVEGGPEGDRITRFPWSGNETILDALAQVNAVVRKDMKIWISRPGADGEFQTIDVDWSKLKSGEVSARDYRLRPGDRVGLQDEGKLKAKSNP